MSKIYEFKAERRNTAGSRMQNYPMDFIITETVFISSPFIFKFFGRFLSFLKEKIFESIQFHFVIFGDF
jgi:hypothetical protein